MLAVQRQLISVGFNLADESEAAFGMVSVLREQMLFRTLRSRSDRRIKERGAPGDFCGCTEKPLAATRGCMKSEATRHGLEP